MGITGGIRIFNGNSFIPSTVEPQMRLLMCFVIKEICQYSSHLFKKKISSEQNAPCFYVESNISIGSQVEIHCHRIKVSKVFLFSQVKVVQGSWESVGLWNGKGSWIERKGVYLLKGLMSSSFVHWKHLVRAMEEMMFRVAECNV